MKASLFIVPAIFTLASGFALADDEFKKFSEVDQNNDGVLSVAEAREALPGLEIAPNSSAATTTSAANTWDNTKLTRDAVERALPQISFGEGDERAPISEEDYDKIVEELEERGMTASTSTRATGAAAASSTRADQNDDELNVGHEDGDDHSRAASASGNSSSTGAAASSTRGGASSSQSATNSNEADSPAADTRINRNTNSTAQPGASNAGSDDNDAADRENEADDDRN